MEPKGSRVQVKAELQEDAENKISSDALTSHGKKKWQNHSMKGEAADCSQSETHVIVYTKEAPESYLQEDDEQVNSSSESSRKTSIQDQQDMDNCSVEYTHEVISADSPQDVSVADDDADMTTHEVEEMQQDSPDDMSEETHSPTDSMGKKGIRSCPAQDLLIKQIQELEHEVNDLQKKRQESSVTFDEQSLLWKKEKELVTLKKKLKTKQMNQARQRRFRADLKNRLSALIEENPELGSKIKHRSRPGRPSLETDQPLLLQTIAKIAVAGNESNDKHSAEMVHTVRSLDDLTEKLKKHGFNLSRSGVYLRLLPRNALTHEGKRHVNTVPVKLARGHGGTNLHPDTQFCQATIHNMEEVASLLGPDEVSFVSQDNKARVQIGLTAATKEAPLLMHMSYKVTLPDRDWVVRPMHKLIPSVYAGFIIKSGMENSVTNFGPTYIAVRSGKHSSFTHSHDLKNLYDLPSFESLLKRPDGSSKPVLMITVDGGPDENPRYQRTIASAIHHFISLDLDAVFIAANAPGRNMVNRVERRMAPLSHDLAGLILPHDHFGSHLDDSGKTVDEALEQKNFAHVGKTLADIWSRTVIDGHPVHAAYVSSQCDTDIVTRDAEWKSRHVRESQYMTQVVKCEDDSCCSPPRSSYFKVIRCRFLPPPLPLSQTSDGLKVAISGTGIRFPSVFLVMHLDTNLLPSSAKSFTLLPYDFACPSVQKVLAQRVCKSCGVYHASLTSLREHNAMCGRKETIPKIRPQRVAARRQKELMCLIQYVEDSPEMEWVNEEDVDTTGLVMPPEESQGEINIPVISVQDSLQNPWIQDLY